MDPVNKPSADNNVEKWRKKGSADLKRNTCQKPSDEILSRS